METTRDATPRPELAGPQLALDAEDPLFADERPRRRKRKSLTVKRSRDPEPVEQLTMLRQCGAPGCPWVFETLVKPQGGGTSGKRYCSFDCQQAAYRWRKREAAKVGQGG